MPFAKCVAKAGALTRQVSERPLGEHFEHLEARFANKKRRIERFLSSEIL
jgi:hypothetical protein